MSDKTYWFDNSSKEWGLFALFLMVTQKGEASTTQHHVEWLDARYESPDAMIAGEPTRMFGTPKLSPEFAALWGEFRDHCKDWSRKKIKRSVNAIEEYHHWRERFSALPQPKSRKTAA